MEALNCLAGIKIKGKGAHQQIIDYVCDKFNLNESIKQFIQEMRDYRNQISYEGFAVKADYIRTHAKKIEEIIDLLFKLVDGKI